MKAGDLRHYVTIEQPATMALDNYGQETPSWERFARVYAAVEPLQGREFWAAQQAQSEQTHKVRMRYLPGVNERMRINFNGRALNIMAVLNTMERNEELVLMCGEARNG